MEQILDINKIKTDVTDIGGKYGVEKVYLFGSYARAQAVENSDIDLRIEKGKIRGLFQLSGFKLALEEKTGKTVDLVTTDSLDNEFLEAISTEEMLIYDSH